MRRAALLFFAVSWAAIAVLPARALQVTDPVKINEICYDPPETLEEPFEFVELYNAGSAIVYLDGAVISDEGNNGATEGTFQFTGPVGGTSLALPAGARLLLVPDATGSAYVGIDFEFYAGGTDSDDPAVPNLTKTAGLASDLQLGNSGDGLTLSIGISNGLIIPCTEIVDGVSWEGGSPGDTYALSRTVCSDSLSHPGTTNTLESLQRCPDGADSDAGSGTDFAVALRTPRAMNNVGGNVCAQVPADFALLAASGGLTPWESIYRVEITALGNGNYRYAAPPDRRAGTWTRTSSFTLSAPALADLWNAIQQQGFLGLAARHCDPTYHDGWFAEITVWAQGERKQIQCQNFTLPPFDAVARKINDKTPPGDDLVYDDINP